MIFWRFLAAKEWFTTKWMEIDYDYLWTGTAIGFRASRELCSNYLLCFSYQSRKISILTTFFWTRTSRQSCDAVSLVDNNNNNDKYVCLCLCVTTDNVLTGLYLVVRFLLVYVTVSVNVIGSVLVYVLLLNVFVTCWARVVIFSEFPEKLVIIQIAKPYRINVKVVHKWRHSPRVRGGFMILWWCVT